MPISFVVDHPPAGELWTKDVLVEVTVTNPPAGLDSIQVRVYEQITESSMRRSNFKHDANGRVALEQVSSTSTYKGVVQAPQPTELPQDANRVLLVGGFSSDGQLLDEVIGEKFFKLMPSRVGVSAKACLFMAFADGGHNGPDGETVANNKPVKIAVPHNATSVTLTAGDQLWRHDLHSSTVSDADGRASPSVALENTAGYVNANLHSLNISGHGTPRPLNLLVALLNYGEGQDCPIVNVGKGPTEVPLPQQGGSGPRPAAVHLGFHDGHEWTNNEGEIEVKIEFNFGSGSSSGPGPVLLAGELKRHNKA